MNVPKVTARYTRLNVSRKASIPAQAYQSYKKNVQGALNFRYDSAVCFQSTVHFVYLILFGFINVFEKIPDNIGVLFV